MTDRPAVSGLPSKAWIAAFLAVLVWILAMLQRGQALSWDEIEFFRATRWTGLGRIPFRDFWEHHTPLQWFLFAPLARLVSGAGASAVLTMRWAQLALWIPALILVFRIGKDRGVSAVSRWCALLLLLASPGFVLSAIEYRIDVPANLFLFAAIAIITTRAQSWWRFPAAGALLSLAVLSNVRFAPLVIVVAGLAFFRDPIEQRWRLHPRTLWMTVGVVLVGTIFVTYLLATGAWTPFVDGVIRYNLTSEKLLPASSGSFFSRLLVPVTSRDPAMIMLWFLGTIGAIFALRRMRNATPESMIAILFVGSLVSVYRLGVHYAYHFQTTYLLLVPLAAMALEDLVGAAGPLRKWRWVPALVLGVAIALNLTMLARPSFGAALEYQDLIMREADRRTASDQRVWDGCGYALHREPAYRYWFLAAGVRLMAEKKLVEPFDAPQIAAALPAAIIYNYRLYLWMTSFPGVERFVVHHYVPLYRNLWIPGLSALLRQGTSRTRWVVPATGKYELRASELLAAHPWFQRPLAYGMVDGPAASELEIPIQRLSRPPAEFRWSVDGRAIAPGVTSLQLKKGSTLELVSSVAAPTGVLVVPEGTASLCMAPDASFVF